MNADLQRAICGLLCIGFEGRGVDDSLRRWLDRGVGGVIVFARNTGPPDAVAALNDEIVRAAGRPIVRGVDQEGGRVARLTDGFTVPPAMERLGRTRDAALAHDVGQVLGREVAGVGFNITFAPVLDLATDRDSQVIGGRSLSDDPAVAGELGAAIVRGIQEVGVMACGKHFPGHGNTPIDSHLALPRVTTSRETIASRELLPFRDAIAAGVASIMPGHLVVEAYDAERPATTSPTIVGDLLRGELGFDGLAISDDLEMGAIVETIGVEAAAVGAVRAGVDLLLVGRSHERAEAIVGALTAAVERGELDAAEVARKSARVQAAAAGADASIDRDGCRLTVGSAEHREIVERIDALAQDNA